MIRGERLLWFRFWGRPGDQWALQTVRRCYDVWYEFALVHEDEREIFLRYNRATGKWDDDATKQGKKLDGLLDWIVGQLPGMEAEGLSDLPDTTPVKADEPSEAPSRKFRKPSRRESETPSREHRRSPSEVGARGRGRRVQTSRKRATPRGEPSDEPRATRDAAAVTPQIISAIEPKEPTTMAARDITITREVFGTIMAGNSVHTASGRIHAAPDLIGWGKQMKEKQMGLRAQLQALQSRLQSALSAQQAKRFYPS